VGAVDGPMARACVRTASSGKKLSARSTSRTCTHVQHRSQTPRQRRPVHMTPSHHTHTHTHTRTHTHTHTHTHTYRHILTRMTLHIHVRAHTCISLPLLFWSPARTVSARRALRRACHAASAARKAAAALAAAARTPSAAPGAGQMPDASAAAQEGRVPISNEASAAACRHPTTGTHIQPPGPGACPYRHTDGQQQQPTDGCVALCGGTDPGGEVLEAPYRRRAPCRHMRSAERLLRAGTHYGASAGRAAWWCRHRPPLQPPRAPQGATPHACKSCVTHCLGRPPRTTMTDTYGTRATR
jgi:hypothetical protein